MPSLNRYYSQRRRKLLIILLYFSGLLKREAIEKPLVPNVRFNLFNSNDVDLLTPPLPGKKPYFSFFDMLDRTTYGSNLKNVL
jgi:hypothetical protein